MEAQLDYFKKQIRLLRFAVCALFFFFAAFMFMAFTKNQKFDEIEVERINVREKDGTLKLVISNKARQHSGRVDGKDVKPREREAGMIFFNRDGDECGGLVYDNDQNSAGMVYSVDKYRDDQIMQLQYMEDTKSKARKYGLQFWTYGKEDAFRERERRYLEAEKETNEAKRDSAFAKMRADGLFATDRMFIGKTFKDELGLFIRDAMGKPRIRLYVNKDNKPVIEFLDEKGKSIPVQMQ